VQTTTTSSCQIELFAGLPPRRKWSRLHPIPCPTCGGIFKPKHGRKYCSQKCAAIQIGRGKKGKPKTAAPPSWHQCGKCHALMGMSGKMSGELVNKDRATICQFRKENGLPTLSKSQATKSTLIKGGITPGQNSEQWWRDNWAGVVDTYWDTGLTLMIAKTKNPNASKSTAHYYANIDKARERGRNASVMRWKLSRPDSLLRIKNKLRNHVYRICKYSHTIKCRKTSDYLGCTIEQAKSHIEKQFKLGMTWDNHGVVWEIDHILPLAAFDLARKDQQLIASHFTNLRPEWKTANRMKSDKITITHQISFA
jgi:endogenous inhibitor of DNA gyrase (YacG/DUF329 family)